MGLPTVEEIKDYLRISTDVEDVALDGLKDTAQAQVARYLGVPLDGDSRTFTGRRAFKGPRQEPFEQLRVPIQPCDDSATITDVDGDEVDDTTYTIDPETGHIDLIQLEAFDNPPYTVVVNVGWTYHPRYTTEVEPVLRQAILDIASDLYNRRNPGEVYNQSGGQVSSTYTPAPIPPRTKELLEILRPKGRGW